MTYKASLRTACADGCCVTGYDPALEDEMVDRQGSIGENIRPMFCVLNDAAAECPDGDDPDGWHDPTCTDLSRDRFIQRSSDYDRAEFVAEAVARDFLLMLRQEQQRELAHV